MMIAVIVLYFLVLLVLCSYGLHRAHLVFLLLKNRSKVAETLASYSLPAELPRVTIQLPLYNEATVVERLLDAVAQIEYPRELLDIQVLDDSNDETRMLASRKVAQLQDQGLDIAHIRRADRVGYKAGALDYGLRTARGELVAIFDADFIPQPQFLTNIVGHFQDPKVAMVQTRWAHLNREHSLLTRAQALLLDGHHMVENQARFASGRLFNFAGTGGIWRKEVIADAGGWQHDTLTEDLDLSYRAQLRGWKFIYRPDITTPSELPEEVSALRAQQYRWAKGTIQCARKLMKRVWNSELTLAQRIEAVFHFTPHLAYPLMMLLSILVLPAVLLIPAGSVKTMLLVDLPLCVGATGSMTLYFALAERQQGRSAWQAIAMVPSLIALGAGLSPLITKAVAQGARHMAGEFVRTPKRGEGVARYRQRVQLPWAEIGLGLWSVTSTFAAIDTDHWFAVPFTGLFAIGYCYVAFQLLAEQWGQRNDVPRMVVTSEG
jgi:cellulose synthase/poly-beta-1,6-N-acetylglucosamine synthase-like glycosyltransferase